MDVNNENGQDFFEEDVELDIEDYKQLKTTDIAKNLGIAESTVRKYAQVMEKQGYQFRKDPTLGRIYTSIDELAINELIKLRKDGNIGLDMAAEIVATRRSSKKTSVSPTQNVQPMQNNDIAMQNINQMMHSMRYIEENMVSKEQMGYLMSSVEKVLDSNTELMRRLGESEDQKLKAEAENKILKEKLDQAVDILQRLDEKSNATEQVAAAGEKKKGFLAKLFG